jgi:opacity protein-like surface antigen
MIRLIAGASFGLMGPAFAGDMSSRATYDWSGFYGGVHAGYGGGMTDWGGINYLAKGSLVGGQIGFNRQIGNAVIGVEADAAWSGMKGSRFEEVTVPFSVSLFQATVASKVEHIETLAVRLGFASDRWLIYMKAGGARAYERYSQYQISTITGIPLPQTVFVAGEGPRSGPMIGFGAEYGFLGNWSAKLEYDYVDFTPQSLVFEKGTLTNFAGVTTTVSTNQIIPQRLHIVKAGLNYRFGPGRQERAPTPPARGYDWSGPYIGAQGAGAWASADWVGFQPQNYYNATGWLGGGTVGVNAQSAFFVAGVEAELMGGSVTGGRTDNFVQAGGTSTQTLATRFDGLAMATVRAGVVPMDRLLLYYKAGVALAHAQQTETFDFFAAPGGVSSFFFNRGTSLYTGGVLGAGAEYAFRGNWSAKLEYNYIHFARQQVFMPGTITEIVPGLGTATTSLPTSAFTKHDMQLMKFGVNYHFADALR